MKRTKFLLLVAIPCAAVLCVTSTVSAGPEPIEPKSVAPVLQPEPFSWTGFYIGGNIGGTWSDYDFSSFTDEIDIDQVEDGFFIAPGAATNGGPGTNTTLGDGFGFASFTFPSSGSSSNGGFSGSDDGLIGGGQIGFNKQWGRFVVGVEGDFQSTSTKSGQTFFGTATNFDFFGDSTSGIFDAFAVTDLAAERRAETNWQASARVRLGYAFRRLLLYATGGAAWADVKVWASESATTEFFIVDIIDGEGSGTSGGGGDTISLGSITYSNLSDHETVFGWTGGGGGEWAVNDKVSIGVQYLHSDYGSHTYHFDAHGGPIFPGDTKVSLENDQVTLRVNILLSKLFGRQDD